jgi:hypothetical protein
MPGIATGNIAVFGWPSRFGLLRTLGDLASVPNVANRPLCAGRNYAQIAPGHVVDSAATRLLASLISVDLNIVSAADRSGGSTYVEADLAIKEKAPAHLEPAHTTMRRFEAPDSRTRFLRTV